ncbi:MAG: MerR family transcriptional regulator [Stackebrandtia sp.]
MRIGELSEQTGVSRRLLRYYEEQGLLTPRRLSSGYRVYAECDIARVGRIRTLLSAGLNTATIRTLLPCVRDMNPQWLTGCPELTDRLRSERDRIDDTMTELGRTRTILDSIIHTAVTTD